jgi:hypothetical protein
VERARSGRSGRYTCAIGAHGQTYQRRISYRSLDPADQHYDAGAKRGDLAICVAPAGISTGSDRAIAVTATGCDLNSRAGGGQKAARAQTSPRRVCAGSAGARGAGSSSGARSRGRERLMLSKAFADR